MVTSSYEPAEVGKAFRAIDEGALAILPKPYGLADSRYEAEAEAIRQTVRLMAEVRVVRRRPRAPRERAALPPPGVSAASDPIRLVAIGASTGGPPALQTILAGLPKNFGAPVVVVQHMAGGFVCGMVDWLNGTSGPRVSVAADGTAVLPGCAYVAPDGLQMGVDGSGRVFLRPAPPEHGLCPSVSYLFRSVAAGHGARAAGVLLSGMGQDGAVELRSLRDLGATTIAQTRDTCVVYGMPGQAVALGGATYQLPPEQIATVLIGLTARRRDAP
jgi:two-component system chemotaxis response regulator CheB